MGGGLKNRSRNPTKQQLGFVSKWETPPRPNMVSMNFGGVFVFVFSLGGTLNGGWLPFSSKKKTRQCWCPTPGTTSAELHYQQGVRADACRG